MRCEICGAPATCTDGTCGRHTMIIRDATGHVLWANLVVDDVTYEMTFLAKYGVCPHCVDKREGVWTPN